jgi:hypothetical protein
MPPFISIIPTTAYPDLISSLVRSEFLDMSYLDRADPDPSTYDPTLCSPWYLSTMDFPTQPGPTTIGSDGVFTDTQFEMQRSRYAESPSSESSTDQAPSSITSYNDSEFSNHFIMETQPQLNSYKHAAAFGGVNLHLDTTKVGTKVIHPSSEETVTCKECCSYKSFGRTYDLDRHIKQKHRCRVPDCSNIKFTSTEEIKQHYEEVHPKIPLGHICGTCTYSSAKHSLAIAI